MSADFGVYFLSDSQPDVDDWIEACSELGYQIKIDDVDLDNHAGPIGAEMAYDGVQGFMFEITDDWGGMEDVYPGEDALFAWFQATRSDWELSAKAALGFARAANGVFSDPLGNTYPNLDEAIKYVEEDLARTR